MSSKLIPAGTCALVRGIYLNLSSRRRMNKRWLSQLLNDSAFPVMALAVAVSQVDLESHKNHKLLHGGQPAAELRFDDHLKADSAKYGSTATENSPVAGRTMSNKDSVHQ